MTGDKPFLGVLLMLAFCLLAPLGDSIAKILSDRVPVFQMLAWRFSLQAIILLPLVWLGSRRLWVSGRVTFLAALRTLLHVIGSGAMFLALRYLPLADAIAIAFVMPFILLLLGKVLMNESVGGHRLGAAVVGFAGTLLVIQPNFANVGAPALLPLVVALAFALFMLVTRQVAKDIDPISLQALSGIMAAGVMVPAAIFAAGSDSLLAFVPVGRSEIGLLVLIGAVGTVAHLLMTWSLRFAPSATLAPMQYLEIPFATLIGWLVFSDLPNRLAALGIVITVMAGLYVIWRERLSAAELREPPRATPPAAE